MHDSWKEALKLSVEGSLWAVPLRSDSESTAYIGWAVALVVRCKIDRKYGYVWFHGFGSVTQEPPTMERVGPLSVNNTVLASFVHAHTLLEAGYVCLGPYSEYKRAEWPWGEFVIYYNPERGWRRKSIDERSFWESGIEERVSDEDASDCYEGGVADPWWYSVVLRKGIELKWRRKPPSTWYNRPRKPGGPEV